MGGAEDGVENLHEPSKSGRGQWRERLKDKASKLTKPRAQSTQHDQDVVADFLYPSSTAASEARPNPAIPPRIDTAATQWASSVPPEDRLEPLGFPAPQPIRKRRPKPPGIHVSFSDQAPEIIGEGGDESEVPANQVVGSWQPSDHAPRPGDGRGLAAHSEPPALLKIGSDDGSAQAARQRTSARPRAGTGWEQRRLSMSMEEGLVQAKKDDVLDPPAPLPEPTIPKLDMDPGSNVKSFEDKPYVAAQTDTGKAKSASGNGADGGSSGFLAYNPSVRLKSTSPRRLPSSSEPTLEAPTTAAVEAEDMPDFGASPTSTYSAEGSLAGSLHHDAALAASYASQMATPVPAPESLNGQSRAPAAKISPESEAAEDFFSRMQHMRGTFKLTAARPHQSLAGEAGQWLRAGIWWFLRGKFHLETELRAASGRPNSRDGEGLPLKKQSYIDLTKAWWIMTEMLPDRMEAGPEGTADPADGLDPHQMRDVYERSRWEISRYLLSLREQNLFPPQALLVQGADPEIWVPYPTLPAGLYAATATLSPRTLARLYPASSHLAFGMPLGDSEHAFSYGRYFGVAQIIGDPEWTEQGGFHCIVSVIRERSQILAEFLVASQDGQLNFHIQSDKRRGPTYNDVRWSQPNTIMVRLSADVTLGIQLREPDFRFLSTVNDYNLMLETERHANDDEELLYGDMVRAFHYMGPPDAKSGFPSAPVPNCKARLFQKTAIITAAGAAGAMRRVFDGYRLTVTSPTDAKTLSSLTRKLPGTKPLLFNNLRGEGGAPALALVLHGESGALESLIFTFETAVKRTALQTILAGTATSPDECFSEDIPLRSLTISETSGRTLPLPQGIQWQRLRVINAGHNLDDAPCLMSERLRVCISCNFGSLTDRANLGAGELQVGLDVMDTVALTLWRPAQNNLTTAFTEGAVHGPDRAMLSEALSAANGRPSLRTYRFASLPVLHDFQALVTGFAVLYDGVASSFGITRHRAVVPRHRHLETDRTRVQILRQTSAAGGSPVLLIAFFRDFAVGRCLLVALQPSDTYESSARAGKFGVRFADARFAMPRPPEEDGSSLICLDAPPAPTEHDDLAFGFDTEDERDLFAKALPASISKASRMAPFRR